MSKFKEYIPHVASIHDEKGKPAFSVLIVMPKKGVTVLIKKEIQSKGDIYHYSFLIGGVANNNWEKPVNETRELMTVNGKEVVHFIIKTDNEGASNHSHAHLYIDNIDHQTPSITKKILKHNGTIHFPGEIK